MLISEDSAWCCILPTYCVQPHVTPQYLKEYSKLTLVISVVVITICALVYFFDNRSQKYFKLSFLKRNSNVRTLIDGNVGAMASRSLSKLKRFLIDAGCQTTGHDRDRGAETGINLNTWYSGHSAAKSRSGESPAAGTGSLKTIRKAINDFVRVVDQERMQSGEPTAAGRSTKNRRPATPPTAPTPTAPTPAAQQLIVAVPAEPNAPAAAAALQ